MVRDFIWQLKLTKKLIKIFDCFIWNPNPNLLLSFEIFGKKSFESTNVYVDFS